MQFISDNILQKIETSCGLDLLDEERKAIMMKKIIALISSRAGIRIMKGFTDEEAREFNEIPEDHLEEMERYIFSKAPDAENIFEEEAQKVIEELLSEKVAAESASVKGE
jgi:(p)ppGpp synthase/HD superfamily hydrolase